MLGAGACIGLRAGGSWKACEALRWEVSGDEGSISAYLKRAPRFASIVYASISDDSARGASGRRVANVCSAWISVIALNLE